MQKQYLETGKIVSTHGVRGEVRVQYWSDEPEFLLDFDTLYLDSKGQKPVEVERARVNKNVVVMKLAGVDTMEQAQALRNSVLYVDRDDVELEKGDYFIQDLIGLSVVDIDSGERYGELCDVSPTGANDVYHIRFADGSEHLIPAIPQVVLEVDLEAGEMRIRPLEGLFEI